MEHRFRLTSSTDFQRVRQHGRSFAHPLMVLVVIASRQPEGLRCGVVAGRAVGGAVQRNRAKRLLREAVRPYLPKLPAGWDIVLIARRPLLGAGFSAIQTTLGAQLKRARLLQDVHDIE